MSVVLLFALPLLAMRLFSEEHSNGTMELLLTRPVSVFQLVIGKYLSVIIILVLLLLLTGVYPLILSIYGHFDFTPLISAYLAVFMIGAGFLAVGLLSSALSESQLIAAFLGFGGNLVLWIISWVSISFADDWQVLSKVFDFISFPGHLHSGIKGVLSSVDVIYFMSFIGFVLFLTHRVISSLRWR
jgi:ABC-2 type transport system permease protein